MSDDVLTRLEILFRKLEADGEYVRANTVALAIAEIEGLRRVQSFQVANTSNGESEANASKGVTAGETVENSSGASS